MKLLDMFPCLSQTYQVSKGFADAEMLAKSSINPSLAPQSSHPANLRIREFCLWVCFTLHVAWPHKSQGERMSQILADRYPFKICDCIILFVSILVIALQAFGARPEKCFGNKPMYLSHAPRSVMTYSEAIVSVAAKTWFEYSPGVGRPPISRAAAAPVIRDFVVRISGYRFPLFFHHEHSFPVNVYKACLDRSTGFLEKNGGWIKPGI